LLLLLLFLIPTAAFEQTNKQTKINAIRSTYLYPILLQTPNIFHLFWTHKTK
jgi:hypothetical protein